jgi:hypothetical protein
MGNQKSDLYVHKGDFDSKCFAYADYLMQLPYDSVHDLLRMTYDLIAIIFCQPDDDYLLHEWPQIGCRYSMGNLPLTLR